ncbi:MAG: hypothetical protein P1S60_08750 [Anaerolineae bacterium]|nr:hypothetical protein [Anaerolineae bacterium]
MSENQTFPLLPMIIDVVNARKGSKIPVNGVKRWKLDMEDDPRWHHLLVK